MPHHELSSAYCRNVPIPENGRTITWDTKTIGFAHVVTNSGHQSFIFNYRTGMVQRRLKLNGAWLRHEAAGSKGKVRLPPRRNENLFAIAEREAKAVQGAVAQGRDPLAELRDQRAKAERADANSLGSIVEEYFEEEGDKLRTAKTRRRLLEHYVYPLIKPSRPIESIKRSEIAYLLKQVRRRAAATQKRRGYPGEDGANMAEQVRRALSRLMHWYEGQSDEFQSPVVRAHTPKVSPRPKRVLVDRQGPGPGDEELRI